VASDSTIHSGSIYTAAGLLKNGVPVIAWYDTGKNLNFSWRNVGTVTTLNVTNVHVVNQTGNNVASGTGFYSNNGTNNTAIVLPQNAITFRLSATTGLILGSRVKLVLGGTTYDDLYVVWIGSQSTNNLNVAFRQGNPLYSATDNILDNIFGTSQSGTVIAPGTTGTVTPDIGGALTGNTFVQNAKVIDSGGKGAHVDLAVDGGNNVHLAYYDADNGGLYYMHIPANSGKTAPDFTTAPTPIRVDTFLTAGTKLMINVRSEVKGGVLRYVPYISYFHGSFTETLNSIRVAWPVEFDANGRPKDGTYKGEIDRIARPEDSFNGNWEVMTVPVAGVPASDEFICNGIPTYTGNGGWVTPTATTGNATTTLTTNPGRSILLGYKTDRWYEGAILKAQLYTP
jgi:hypothetical protein